MPDSVVLTRTCHCGYRLHLKVAGCLLYSSHAGETTSWAHNSRKIKRLTAESLCQNGKDYTTLEEVGARGGGDYREGKSVS